MHIIWTWQFELNDILTTLTIVGLITGAVYRLLVLPLLNRLETQRIQDSVSLSIKWDALMDTLNELKEEVRQSRSERVKSEATFVMLTTKLESLEKRFNELREELHDHTASAHGQR